MKKAIAAPALSLMFALTCFSELNLSFEGSLDGFQAGSANVTLSSVTDHVTDGINAVKAEHAVASGQVALAKIGKANAAWWNAVTDPDNDTMSIDFTVPASAIDTNTWGKIMIRFFGSNFDITGEAALTALTDNSGTLTLDYSSVKENVPSATWATAQLIINAGAGTSRSPVYFDNYRVYSTSGTPAFAGLLQSFEEGSEGWFPLATDGALTNLTTPDIPAAAITMGSHALEATHTDPGGLAELARINQKTAPDWWAALRDPDNKTMQMDVFVPGEVIDSGTWATISLKLQGGGFSALNVSSNLVLHEDNRLTVVLDYSSVTAAVQVATWAQATISINSDGGTRTPVYLDNYQIYADAPYVSTNEPPTVLPAELLIAPLGASLRISTTNLSSDAGVTNILQGKTALFEVWNDLYSVTGAAATNWTIPATNASGFFRIISVY